MARVHITHQTLKALPGCLQSLVLQKVGGSGQSNVVTIVEWASPAAIDAALAHMRRKYLEEGYDPVATTRRLGIRADLGLFANADHGGAAPAPALLAQASH